MLQNTTPRGQSKPVQGREVIEEAARLLRRMHFPTRHGTYAEGHHVVISVDLRWNDDHESMRVLLTCYALGHRRVDWEGLPVFVLHDDGGTTAFLVRLGARGQAVIANLPPGAYRLSTSSHYGWSAAPVRLPIHRPGWMAAQKAPQSADATDTEGLQEAPVYASRDGRVHATVRQTQAGTTVVAFETQDATLAHAVVRFAFVRESGQVEQSAAVELEPIEGEARLWEGRWEGVVRLSGPCALGFAVLPQDGEAEEVPLPLAP